MNPWVIGIAAAIAFAAGWQTNGWKWEAKYQDLQIAVEQARADGEKAAREAVSEAYQLRLQEAERLLLQEREATDRQQKRVRALEVRNAEVESRYRESLQDPDCSSWDAGIIACPVELHPSLTGETTGDSEDSGADEVGTSPPGTEETVHNRIGKACYKRRSSSAVAGIAECARYV